MDIIDQSGCIRVKCLNLGKTDCIRVFGQYCKVVVFVIGQKSCISAKLVVFGQNLVVFGEIGCI